MNKKTITRNEEINTLFQIIDNADNYKEISENGLIILLNGPWGSGKTTFIKELVEEIESKENYELFNNYNAYESDYYENAYIPFFASIVNKINLKKEFTNFIKCVTNETSKNLIVTSYVITKTIFKTKFGVDLDDIKQNLMEIEKENQDNDLLKNYNDLKQYKEKIKKEMVKLSNKNKQIFIIDELDRCKPTFAMNTLEIIKHFFDIDNCVFIISVDKIQIEESAKTIYGIGMDSEKYFSKFFDYQFNLQPLNFYDTIREEHDVVTNDLKLYTSRIFNILNISVRDGNKIFNELVEKNENWTIEQSIFMLFLIILKYTDLSFYNSFLNGSFNKFKKIILEDYNKEYYKYIRLFGFKIDKGLSFDEILGSITRYLNLRYDYLGQDANAGMISIGSGLKAANEVQNNIKLYVPKYDERLTVKENISNIIG